MEFGVILKSLTVLDTGLIQGLIQSLLSLSIVITLLSLDFPDLTIEGSFPLGAALGGVLLTKAGFNPLLTLLVVFCAGYGAGTLTGLIHVRFKMSKLLSSISVAAMLYSVSLWVMGGGASLSLLDRKTIFTFVERADASINAAWIRSPRFYAHPIQAVLLMIMIAVFFYLGHRFLSSEFGVVLRAIGMNENGLRHYGRKSGFYKIVGLGVGNGLAAVGGSLQSQVQGFADVNMGIGVLVTSLLAVVLGQELWSRFRLPLERPRQLLFAVLIGSVAYQMVMTGIMTLGVPPTSLRFISGFLLVLLIVFKSKKGEVSFKW